MKALFLERKEVLAFRDFDCIETVGPDDVRIKIHTVGICGSDLHYYRHGQVGRYLMQEPLILGHEASGTVLEVGANVQNLRPGDRVCMEPGVPDPRSKATRLGRYNLDPQVRFWSVPPYHGVLRESVVHPAPFVFKLPDHISFAEGALVEPLAIGMYGAQKAEIKPGDVALVFGAGTIGTMTTLSALAGGCSKVILADIVQERLDRMSEFGPIVPVNPGRENLLDVVSELTDGWGADIIFEATGTTAWASQIFDPLCPGGRIIWIGLPSQPVPLDLAYATVKEARILTLMRYAHIFPRALALMGSGQVDLKPFITDVYPFSQSIEAFAYANDPRPSSIKVQIVMET